MEKKEILKKVKRIKEKLDEYELFPEDYEDEFNNFLDSHYNEIDYIRKPSETMRLTEPELYQSRLNEYIEKIDEKETIGYKDLLDKLDDLEYELEEME